MTSINIHDVKSFTITKVIRHELDTGRVFYSVDIEINTSPWDVRTPKDHEEYARITLLSDNEKSLEVKPCQS